MDSEHRHELKENDLRETLTHWREVWDKYGTPITLVLLVAVLAFSGYRLYGSYQATKHQSAWSDLAATASPEGMARVAEEHDLHAVRMLALLRGADLYLEEAVFLREIDEPGASAAAGEQGAAEDGGEGQGNGVELTAEVEAVLAADPELQRQRLDRAAEMYGRVVEAARSPVFRCNALLGLAAVAESREQWDQASSHYDRAEAAATEHELPELASLASHRRGMLDTLRQPVAMVEAPEAPANAEASEGEASPSSGAAFDELIDVPDLVGEGGGVDGAIEGPADTETEGGE